MSESPFLNQFTGGSRTTGKREYYIDRKGRKRWRPAEQKETSAPASVDVIAGGGTEVEDTSHDE